MKTVHLLILRLNASVMTLDNQVWVVASKAKWKLQADAEMTLNHPTEAPRKIYQSMLGGISNCSTSTELVLSVWATPARAALFASMMRRRMRVMVANMVTRAAELSTTLAHQYNSPRLKIR